jgi:hypothetical protein
MVMGEPDYVDQVPRREAYEAAHPDVEITYLGPYWKAVVTEERGQIVITRYELKDVQGQAGSARPRAVWPTIFAWMDKR